MEFKDLEIKELIKNTYSCECGLVHDPGIEKIEISEQGIEEGVSFILTKAKGTIIVISDENTYKIAGKTVFEKIKRKNQDTYSYIIPLKNDVAVVPNESTIGETLIRMPQGIDFFVAVGSGVVNDVVRNISYHLGKKYVVIGTAPSMDGYASITSALIINNLKESCPGQVPIGIFADINILKNAPYTMLTAGFGDVLSKYNAVREWRFGRDLNKEHYCEKIADLIWKAADKCSDSAALLKQRDKKAVENIMEALILSGIAMGMYTNTRPGSGAEHHLVHYWDVEFIKRGWEHPLHGNSVGVALCVICRLYDIVKDKLPVKVMDLDTEKIEGILKNAGCETDPKALGIPEDIFHDSILYGYLMSRTKYTVLTHLNKCNKELLNNCAVMLTKHYYS
ncbi:MAG TPA: sn-glycerol-1-phosphate dehydrogenase [Clostridia bacterium]|jgi:glycerol-1-phosphate dehydrogenase [NAD(P)+]|nr:MAG: Glycerol-1-phosphate dehydrogenase (NAD(P)+) [Firmicutes bacterium ADurb.Bin146]HOD92798.1 sn-glycerol-1-phosphate dehydrogenase [Clostridia bacterium]HQM39568.1 sn-glycerol-1-phosphate dehydrogenase [Clostridia bacterium]